MADEKGIRINIQDVEELWGLTSGGLHPGPTYDGMTAVALLLDTKRAFGWHDGLLNISALQIRGRSLTGERLGALNAVSGYDAGRSTRLFELWYGQGFFGNRLDIRVGTIDLDTEFLVSQNASFFLNSSFGWPLSTSSNLYSGGPSWPFSAVGARIKWVPAYPLVLMGAITDDNPTRGPFYSDISATQRDPTGTSFSTKGGALFMGKPNSGWTQPNSLPGRTPLPCQEHGKSADFTIAAIFPISDTMIRAVCWPARTAAGTPIIIKAIGLLMLSSTKWFGARAKDRAKP